MKKKILPVPENEEDRLRALANYEILNTLSEDEFDRITRLATLICQTPVSLVSLLDEHRQWFKSRVGLDISETRRELAFCQYTIMDNALFEVPDATKDERFEDNELVTGPTGIRFYAGYPLTDSQGYNLGTLCVIDWTPRQLSDDQKTALELLAKEVMTLITERRQKEELRNFEKLFQLSSDLICVAGTEGYFKRINPALQKLLGIYPPEVYRMSFYAPIHPDDRAATSENVARIGAGETIINFTMRVKSANGEYRYIQWVASPEPRTMNFFAVGRDVTETYILEKNLEETRQMLEDTNRVARIGGWKIDMDDRGLYWSPVTKEIHGVPADYQPELQSAINFYKEGESRNAITEAVTRALETGAGWDLELEVVTSPNSSRWVRAIGTAEMAGGRCKRLYGTFQDIDEKKKTQLQISRSKAILRAFVTHAPAAVAMLDKEMQYIAASQRWIEEYHLQETYTPGKSYYELFPFISEEGKMRHRRVLGGAVEHADEEAFSFPPFSSVQYQAWEMRPWFELTGEIGGMMISTQNVTSLVSQREELKHAKIQAEQANIAKSEFLANMSHEIRTPLNGVIGFTDLVLKTKLSSVQQQYLTIVNQSAGALLNVLNDILDFSKIEAGKLELDIDRYDIFEMSAEATDIISYQVQNKGLEMLLDISPELPRFIWTDSIRLKQILINLLSNASKFTEKGEIELKIESLGCLEDNHSKIRFSVRDTGIGIRPEKQQKIFEAFSQEDGSTTKKYGGTGLGLTISNKLLEMMNSRLQLCSKPGEGSVFFFDLTVKSASGEPIIWEGLDRIKNVLVVDDNNHNREILQQMLLLKNIQSVPAKNGLEALQLLAAGNTFDAILMDYQMPLMDGLETIRKIRENFAAEAALPVLLLSSSSDNEQVILETEQLHINHRLLKPVKMQDLYLSLSRLHQLNNQSAGSNTPGPQTAEGEFSVLVAEDNAVNMLLATTILRRIAPAATIIEAVNGVEALNVCKERMPDIVLMDIQMPGMNGYEATSAIRSLPDGEAVCIIALTAGNLKSERDKCLASGMNDFIVKPVVEETIAGVLLKWLNIPAAKKSELPSTGQTEDKKHYVSAVLEVYAGGNQDMIREVIKLTRTELERFPTLLKDQIRTGNLHAINQLGHKMYGTAVSVGLPLLAGFARDLEEKKVFHSMDLTSLLENIEKEINLIQRLLRQ